MDLKDPTPMDLVLECESFVAHQRDGKIVLAVKAATTSADLPPRRNYLNKSQAAQRLGTSPRTLDNWMTAKRNPIPFIRLGRRPRFVEEEIMRWAESGASCTARRANQRISAARSRVSLL